MNPSMHQALRRLGGTLFLLFCLAAQAAQDHGAFSFLVTGDSRSEPFLPYGRNQETRIREILRHRYPGRPLRLDYGVGGMLSRVLVGAEGGKQIRLQYRNGWPARIDRRQGDGPWRRVLDRQGRLWVFDHLVEDIRRGAHGEGPGFIVHGGDITLNGFQGRSLAERPYWQAFNSLVLLRLPAVDPDLGLPGRLLAAVGNHETWDDPELRGMLTSLPWLEALGLGPTRRVYALPYRGSRFVFLDSGDYCPHGPCWNGRHPDFEGQMAFLEGQLQTARENGEDPVFVVYHKPSFAHAGHGPLPAGENPHPVLRRYARDLNLIVINSHVHTTERFEVDGVHYLVVGGGGAPQALGRARHPSPEPELYWGGRPHEEEYNYLRVDVNADRVRVRVHRFRPPAAPEWAEVLQIGRHRALAE